MVHLNKSPIKNFGEKEAWAYPWTAQIFWVPPIAVISQELVKLRTSNFARIFIKNFWKVAVGIVRDPNYAHGYFPEIFNGL